MQNFSFSSNLRVLRAKANLRQSELAAEIGVGQNLISRWEVGGATPRVDQVIKIAHALDCRIAELFEGCDMPREEKASTSPVAAAEGRSATKAPRKVVRTRQQKTTPVLTPSVLGA